MNNTKVTLTSKSAMDIVEKAFQYGIPLLKDAQMTFDRYLNLVESYRDIHTKVLFSNEYQTWCRFERFGKWDIRRLLDIDNYRLKEIEHDSKEYVHLYMDSAGSEIYDIMADIRYAMKEISRLKEVAMIENGVNIEISQNELDKIFALSNDKIKNSLGSCRVKMKEFETKLNEHKWWVPA